MKQGNRGAQLHRNKEIKIENRIAISLSKLKLVVGKFEFLNED